MLVLDGHGNNVTLEAIKQALEFELTMITLPCHTSHALQPLNVSYFKPFKTTFKKVKHVAMSNNNHTELDKITLARWVNWAIIKDTFKATCIWPFNP